MRNLIYRFALGGQHIHVTQNRRSLRGAPRFSVCEDVDHNSDSREGDESNFCWGPWGPHYCSARPFTDLLRVSRQIYDEAALIPFANNVFMFGESWAANGYSQLNACLMPAQSRAIQHVVLCSYIERRRSPTPHGLPNLARTLSGLKTLQLVIELNVGWPVDEFEAHIAPFRSFTQCRLRTARVVLEKPSWLGKDGIWRYPHVPKSVIEKAEELERELSMSPEEVEQQRHQAEQEKQAKADRDRRSRADMRARRGLRPL